MPDEYSIRYVEGNEDEIFITSDSPARLNLMPEIQPEKVPFYGEEDGAGYIPENLDPEIEEAVEELLEKNDYDIDVEPNDQCWREEIERVTDLEIDIGEPRNEEVGNPVPRGAQSL